MKPEDLITLNEEIAGMARAGLPLDQGLAALSREMGRGRLRQVTEEIAADLRAGRTLQEAIQRQGKRVPPYYAGLVAAGVRSGRVHEVLATLTVYARSIADLKATVANAVFYPAMVFIFSCVLFSFLCFFVLPQFESVFQGFGMVLPTLTQVAFAIGRHPLEYIIYPLGGFIVGILLIRFLLNRTQKGRIIWTRFFYAVPILGSLVRGSRLAAFSELLSILVEHGMPLPEAFRLAGQASSDPLVNQATEEVERDLAQGKSLAEILKTRRLVPELLTWMIGVGEQRATLGKTLHQVAEIYRRQAELRAGILRNVLPPFLIIGTAGVLVTFFVFALMLPMIKLLEGLSK